MSYPIWLTPPGNLGIVPELEYYRFPFATYNADSAPTDYSVVSGALPPGIQLIAGNVGVLEGTPVSTSGHDQNVKYTFTIRATDAQAGTIADRTFYLTVTNIAPPVIYPRNVDLGSIFDGSLLDLQLNAVEYIPGAALTWTLKSGALPPGVTLTTTGLLYGVIDPIPAVGPNGEPGWDDTPWDELGWQFPLGSVTKTFTWTVETTDGVNYDTSTYILKVVPRSSLTVDSNLTVVSQTTLFATEPYTVDLGARHYPIITTTQADFAKERQGGWFALQIKATDLDDDPLTYSIPPADAGAFDEQYLIGNSIPYITSIVTNNTLTAGVFPKTAITNTQATVGLYSGNAIVANVGDVITQPSQGYITVGGNVITATAGQYITQSLTGANALVTSSVTNSLIVPVAFINGIAFNLNSGNLKINGANVAIYPTALTFPGASLNTATATVTANVVNSLAIPVNFTNGYFTTTTGQLFKNNRGLTAGGNLTANIPTVPASVTTSVPTVVSDNTTPGLLPGSQVQVLQPITSISSVGWNLATVTNQSTIQLTGNAIITATAGQYMTQAVTGANARISNVSTTTGTLSLAGNILVGTITILGNILTAKAGQYITQASTGANAQITANVTNAVTIPVSFTNGTIFNLYSGNLQLNGANISAYPTSVSANAQPVSFTASVGNYIYQPSTGAAALVLVTQPGGTSASVQFVSGAFNIGSGNVQIDGRNVSLYPANIIAQTSITAAYTNSSIFRFNTSGAYVKFNGASTYAIPTSVLSVGVTIGGSTTQGTPGFDGLLNTGLQSKYDQSTLAAPGNLMIDSGSGWITGYLPTQTENEVNYSFEVQVSKTDYPGYTTSQQYNLDVLGDLNNYITWITPSYLGTIDNGAVSELSVEAVSSKNKALYYTYTPGALIKLPQGLELTTQGYLSGRVSFEVFRVDAGQTTFDVTNSNKGVYTAPTTFDTTYEFSITATTYDQTVALSQTFILVVSDINTAPYENLYLKALLPSYQRVQFQQILQDRSVFPPSMIYRSEDPYYGLATDIKFLFLAGLNPSTLSSYAEAIRHNTFTKRVNFGSVKTAVATDGSYDVQEITSGNIIGTYSDTIGFIPLPQYVNEYPTANTQPAGTTQSNQHVIYEVVYLTVSDDNTTNLGFGPPDTEYPAIANPYETYGNAYGVVNGYVVAYPNSFENMANVVVNSLGYENQGALPTWMTSIQPNGTVPGFVKAVVLAYTEPGASSTIAYRFQQAGYQFNQFNFVVDRYLLNNSYTANYDVMANAFVTSTATTFDRYPSLEDTYTNIGSVDYAVSIPFESINERAIDEINKTFSTSGLPGLDGITSFKNGQTLVFFEQEYRTNNDISSIYNQGWFNNQAPWDSSDIADVGEWDYNSTEGWDPSTTIPGYTEWIESFVFNSGIYSYSRPNQRIGIWTININSDNYVRLIPTQLPSCTVGSISGTTMTVNGTVTATFQPGMMIYGTGVAAGTYIVRQLTSTESVSTLRGKRGTYQVSISQSVTATTFYQDMTYSDSLYVKSGLTYGGTNIFYDSLIKPGLNYPNYSVIPQQLQSPTEGSVYLTLTGEVIGIYKLGVGFTPTPTGVELGYLAGPVIPAGSRVSTLSTIFDGNGTAFYDKRDKYTKPEQGDSYLKFPSKNVFE